MHGCFKWGGLSRGRGSSCWGRTRRGSCKRGAKLTRRRIDLSVCNTIDSGSRLRSFLRALEFCQTGCSCLAKCLQLTSIGEQACPRHLRFHEGLNFLDAGHEGCVFLFQLVLKTASEVGQLLLGQSSGDNTRATSFLVESECVCIFEHLRLYPIPKSTGRKDALCVCLLLLRPDAVHGGTAHTGCPRGGSSWDLGEAAPFFRQTCRIRRAGAFGEQEAFHRHGNLAQVYWRLAQLGGSSGEGDPRLRGSLDNWSMDASVGANPPGMDVPKNLLQAAKFAKGILVSPNPFAPDQTFDLCRFS
mmetsp:Transcript_44042/g.94929  ORF Transcript_44042/g.94929 Transcript_44042/m.94929 type:complete len:301 (-) Transcript_44042:149-1051(-)